jgi:hypothetical protein
MDDVRKIADLRAAVEKHTLAERECPANKAFLGDTLCPKCGASASEGCGSGNQAAWEVVQAARAYLKDQEHG